MIIFTFNTIIIFIISSNITFFTFIITRFKNTSTIMEEALETTSSMQNINTISYSNNIYSDKIINSEKIK